MPVARVRTTVAIAEDVLAAVDSAVQEGLANSRNEFLDTALKNQLAASRRAAIDAAFAGMAEDSDYQREAVKIAAEFEVADHESNGLPFLVAKRALGVRGSGVARRLERDPRYTIEEPPRLSAHLSRATGSGRVPVVTTALDDGRCAQAQQGTGRPHQGRPSATPRGRASPFESFDARDHGSDPGVAIRRQGALSPASEQTFHT